MNWFLLETKSNVFLIFIFVEWFCKEIIEQEDEVLNEGSQYSEESKGCDNMKEEDGQIL